MVLVAPMAVMSTKAGSAEDVVVGEAGTDAVRVVGAGTEANPGSSATGASSGETVSGVALKSTGPLP